MVSRRMDTLTSTERSERMSRVRAVDTGPEKIIRSLVHSLGYRFRLHDGKLPGRPDLVLPRHQKVIFVHGCFWHRHDNPTCKLARLPKSRLEFWLPKLESNRQRDLKNQAALRATGWNYLVLWECELRDRHALELKIKDFLGHEIH